MYSPPYSPKQYAFLGKILANKRPDIAKELFDIAAQAGQPLCTDHAQISLYYTRFCAVMAIDPEEYRGPLHKAGKVDIRRLFIASILRIYQPQIYVLGFCRINKGLVRELGTELRHPKQKMSKMIREVVFMEKVYDDFRAKVEHVVHQLMEKEEGYGSA